MTDLTFATAQADTRRAYLCGAPGVLTSGLVWLAAAGTAALVSSDRAVLVLLLGGALIFPVSLVVTKLLGASGKHAAGNALGGLAGESTVWLITGCIIAYGAHLLRGSWFFPVMLLVIGSRYFAFQTVYGMRTYWVLGALLWGAGMAIAMANGPAVAGALAGAVIELVVAGVLFVQARRRSA
ncbi:MAG: hypothetical protein IT355_06185 [Gemmatimonadaceae bacterium]|nr:hypothetical protein [Gemmatimonadaceae bacterium]